MALCYSTVHGQFYIDELQQPEPFISTLNIASCLFDVSANDQAQEMAKKLGEYIINLLLVIIIITIKLQRLAHTGFIQLTFDLRMKFYPTPQYIQIMSPGQFIWIYHPYRYRILCECIHQFLVSFCFHLERNRESAAYVRDVLQAAMPQINCRSHSTKILLKYFAPPSHIHVHVGSATDYLQFLSQRTVGLANLQTLQSAVLALFYYAYTNVQDEE